MPSARGALRDRFEWAEPTGALGMSVQELGKERPVHAMIHPSGLLPFLSPIVNGRWGGAVVEDRILLVFGIPLRFEGAALRGAPFGTKPRPPIGMGAGGDIDANRLKLDADADRIASLAHVIARRIGHHVDRRTNDRTEGVEEQFVACSDIRRDVDDIILKEASNEGALHDAIVVLIKLCDDVPARNARGKASEG